MQYDMCVCGPVGMRFCFFFPLASGYFNGKKKFMPDLYLAAIQELNIAICYSNIPPESFSKNTNYLSYA